MATNGMGDGKWITGLSLTMPLRRAALRVLRPRLQLVQSCFPLAAEHAHEDVEHVHQLRVATRRARAAVELFRETIDEKLYEELRRHLRRIRRGAGAARDSDVMLTHLLEHLRKIKSGEKLGLHGLAGRLTQVRGEAQRTLRDAYTTWASEFDRSVRRCLRELRDPHAIIQQGPLVGHVAAPHLLALVDALEALADGEGHSHEALHQVRIVGKQLRYALEIFASCFPTALRDGVYPRVEEMQDLLGELNDAHVAQVVLTSTITELQGLLPVLWKDWRKGLEGYVRHCERLVESRTEAFRQFWTTWKTDDVRKQLATLVQPEKPTGNGMERRSMMKPLAH